MALKLRHVAVAGAAAALLAGGVSLPAASAATNTCLLPVGTAGIPDLPEGGTSGFSALRPAPSGLPGQVYFRTTTQTYNTHWSFLLRSGRIYTKPVDAVGGWRVVLVPACLNGAITGISVDDDELVATGPGNHLFTMDHTLNGPSLWNWTSRYGTPFWIGLTGNTLPEHTIDWSWSVDSPNTTKTWTDAAGNAQPIGGGKVSSVYALTGDGSQITFMDPWLPADHSFHLEAPLNGRFQATAISVSGSTMFLINKYGDMYTRQDDFDEDGSDTVFYRYSYDSQAGKPVATNAFLGLLPSYAAVQLPVPGWLHQPKVPGAITGMVSIAQNGVGTAARILRVEGQSNGHTGFWQKALYASSWTFVRTDQPLSRPLQANPPGDWSQHTLASVRGFTYAGQVGTATIRTAPFDVASETTPLTVSFPDGSHLTLVLHAVDALRQTPMPDGLASVVRTYNAAVEVPAATLTNIDALSAPARAFVTGVLRNKRFTTSTMGVSTSTMKINALNWTLTR